MKSIFILRAVVALAVGTLAARVRAAPSHVGRFAPHEVTLTATGDYRNPYTDLAADATLTEPDGRATRVVPLFWDGGTTWRFRFAPDKLGTWTWAVKSADAGLNGRSGSFECIASDRRGSFQPLTDAPHHFQYQSGEKAWFLGDTAWAFVTDNAEEKHDRTAAERYVSNRAKQGFNAIHIMLLNEAGWGNRGGPPWHTIGEERINPAYFQEADERIAFANGVGVVVGIALAWGEKGHHEPYAWGQLPSLAARERYARYATARYAAYDVYFLVSGEWHGEIRTRPAAEADVRREFVRLGDVVRAADAHGRMIGIHPMTAHGSTREFNAASTWMSFGDYQQNYSRLHARILESRTLNKPVVNSEYAYWLRASNPAGVVDKPHSYTVDDIRAATWDIVMAGGYVVAGFGSTYMGGNRHPTPFLPDDPKNAPWERQSGLVKSFFSSLEFERLEPHDELVTSTARRTDDRTSRIEVGGRQFPRTQAPATTYWCLADPGRSYVVYVRGTTEPVSLALERTRLMRAEQFDPRTGARLTLPVETTGRWVYRPPDPQDWVIIIRAN